MDGTETATVFAELYPEVYRRMYRRRDPRKPRPSGEALAMLQHLRDSGPLTVTEAARHFDRSQAAISERVERMIGRGLLARIEDERDRRRHFLWLTRKGEDLLRAESQVLSTDLVRRATARMDAADRVALIRGMRALLDASREDARQEREEKP